MKFSFDRLAGIGVLFLEDKTSSRLALLKI